MKLERNYSFNILKRDIQIFFETLQKTNIFIYFFFIYKIKCYNNSDKKQTIQLGNNKKLVQKGIFYQGLNRLKRGILYDKNGVKSKEGIFSKTEELLKNIQVRR